MSTENLLQAILNKDTESATDILNTIMAEKVSDAIESRSQDVAQTMFSAVVPATNTEEE